MNRQSAATVTHAQAVRGLIASFLDAGWKPAEIDDLELWAAARLCGVDAPGGATTPKSLVETEAFADALANFRRTKAEQSATDDPED